MLIPRSLAALACAALLLSACAATPSPPVAAPPPVEAAAAVPVVAQQEDFLRFFQQFVGSKRFAVSRTRYPLRVLRQEPGADIQRSELTREQDAQQPVLGLRMAKEGLRATNEAPVDGKARVVVVKKDKPEWQIVYLFVSEEGNWYLDEMQDYSR